MAAGLVVFYMASAIETARQCHGTDAVGWIGKVSSAAVATLVPLLSSLAGLATRSNGQGRPSGWRIAAQRLTLPAIIFVLLSAIAWGNLRITESIEYHWLNPTTRCSPGASLPCHPTGAGFWREHHAGGESCGLWLDRELVRASESLFVARHVSAAADSNLPRSFAA
jgi:hypothetical protein